MPKYMVHHKLIKASEQVAAWWAQAAPVFAGRTRPAVCRASLYLDSQRPGRTQPGLLPVEGESAEKVMGFMAAACSEWMTAEIMAIGETDWLA